jgi:hypothetical protein
LLLLVMFWAHSISLLFGDWPEYGKQATFRYENSLA